MPLSTSNSDGRAPAGPWARTWLAAIALSLLVLGSWEAVLHHKGYTASVRDDAGLWMLARSRVREDDRKQIVLLGASRIQLAVDLDTFEREWGQRPVQLAVNGFHPYPALRHLARDTEFKGLVIHSVTPFQFTVPFEADFAEQAEYIAAYNERTPTTLIEQRIAMAIEGRLAFRRGATMPRRMAAFLLAGKWPPRPVEVFSAGRQGYADYAACDLESARSYREQVGREAKPPLPPEEFRQELLKLEEELQTIHNRGGQVVILRMNSSGVLRQMEEDLIPRRDYWDVLASSTSAVTIHFDDHAELRKYECPEWSHLDFRDAPHFTRALVAVLKRALEISKSGTVPDPEP